MNLLFCQSVRRWRSCTHVAKICCSRYWLSRCSQIVCRWWLTWSREMKDEMVVEVVRKTKDFGESGAMSIFNDVWESEWQNWGWKFAWELVWTRWGPVDVLLKWRWVRVSEKGSKSEAKSSAVLEELFADRSEVGRLMRGGRLMSREAEGYLLKPRSGPTLGASGRSQGTLQVQSYSQSSLRTRVEQRNYYPNLSSPNLF